MCGTFKQRLFCPQPMLAELVTMVAGKQDDGVVVQIQLLELCQHTPDLRIHEAGRGKIGLHGITRLVHIWIGVAEHIVVRPQCGRGHPLEILAAFAIERRQGELRFFNAIKE